MRLATARDGELAAEALGVAEATHGAHGEPVGSMPERELFELLALVTARVEAPRHQVRSGKSTEPKWCSSRPRARDHHSCRPPRGTPFRFTPRHGHTPIRSHGCARARVGM